MRRVAIIAGLLMACVAVTAAGIAVEADPQAAMPTPHMPPTPSGLGQLVDGEGLYQLYCITCHGDELRGLTPEWIAQWPATHQNCWVSKCHGPNHPPDGYQLPREVPALAGPGALAKFRSATDLHAFLQARMPYQEPGLLAGDEYWAITAFMLRENGIEVPEWLDAENAGTILLPAGEVDASATPVVQPAPTVAEPVAPPARPMDPTLSIVAVLLGVVVGVVLFLRRRPRPPSGRE